MKRPLIAASAYFLVLFALGFVLGALRVIFVAPRIGPLAGVCAEVPVMVIAAFFASRWAIRRWQVAPNIMIRFAMTVWFLALLLLFETVFGTLLFGRTAAAQMAAMATLAGLVGLSGQIIAALMPVFVRR
jgi:hypothetical protein